jgi:hypothetical protein
MNNPNKLDSSPSLTQVLTRGLYCKHITMVNDNSRFVSQSRSKLWCHFLISLEVSFMLLDSSIMLLENIYSTGITYDDHHLQSSYV